MRWPELRRMLAGKLKATYEDRSNHQVWFVYCGDTLVGRVLVSRNDHEMRGHEFGNVARSLKISERQLRELVACTMSREDFCAQQ